jgi:polysaccharide biosynthesis/export protein
MSIFKNQTLNRPVIRPISKLAISLFLVFLLMACASGGQVVSVTDVGNSDAPLKYVDLKQEELERIKKLKKTVLPKEQDSGESVLTDILQKSTSYTVAEYLAKYPAAKTAISDYKVGGYDVLSIIVYEEKDLSRESVRVTAEGYITFPLIGRIRVADLTTTEIEKLIAGMLAEKEYLLDAHVSVMVVKYEGRKFAALGAIANPGQYPLQARERVLDGISKAGGLASSKQSGGREEPQAQEGMIIRTLNQGKPTEEKIVINFDLHGLLKGRDPIANILLAENDVIYIPSADFFYIIGEVKNPGSYAFTKKEISIVEAISMAGGFTHIAARNKTRIVRVEDGKEKIYEVSMDAITKSGKMIQAVQIKPNDLIVIPESFF